MIRRVGRVAGVVGLVVVALGFVPASAAATGSCPLPRFGPGRSYHPHIDPADLGPRVDGYRADCANTVVFGRDPTPEEERYFVATRDACLSGIAALRRLRLRDSSRSARRARFRARKAAWW